jgi:hypothetical protein
MEVGQRESIAWFPLFIGAETNACLIVLQRFPVNMRQNNNSHSKS